MARPELHTSLQYELNQERASALGRAGRALEKALAELATASGARRDDAFAEAAERLWCMVIQREAMGINRHEPLYEVYRVPTEVRLRMGPRRIARAMVPRRWS